MLRKLFLPVLVLVIALAVAGCGDASANIEKPSAATQVNSPVSVTTGVPQAQDGTAKEQDTPAPATSPARDTGPQKITVSELNKNSAAFIGKEVIMEGKIVQECGSGCWFNLQDSTGVVYVDLAPNNMVIPQKVGSKAKVYGKVDKRSGITYVIGSKVEF
ncbi:MAG: hypothetical protein A2Z02_07470 [Chloroflexi bacterium RBG_16_48_7]|nr:MAG: hypothetical protein A2Z02_07470 [Chloroflexi bacterium RBG_16_48_7]